MENLNIIYKNLPQSKGAKPPSSLRRTLLFHSCDKLKWLHLLFLDLLYI